MSPEIEDKGCAGCKPMPKWRQDFPIEWEGDHYVSRREMVKFLTLGSLLLAMANWVVALASRVFRRGSHAERYVGSDETRSIRVAQCCFDIPQTKIRVLPCAPARAIWWLIRRYALIYRVPWYMTRRRTVCSALATTASSISKVSRLLVRRRDDCRACNLSSAVTSSSPSDWRRNESSSPRYDVVCSDAGICGRCGRLTIVAPDAFCRSTPQRRLQNADPCGRRINPVAGYQRWTFALRLPLRPRRPRRVTVGTCSSSLGPVRLDRRGTKSTVRRGVPEKWAIAISRHKTAQLFGQIYHHRRGVI